MTHNKLMIAALMLGAALMPPAVYAQVIEAQERTFSAEAGAIVNAALEYSNDGNFEAALRELDKALAIKALSPYELSTIYQMQGSAHYNLGDYKNAIASFESAINAGGMSREDIEPLELNIAQLLIADKQYERGANRMELYFQEVEEVDPKHAQLLTSAWMAIGQYERALPWAKLWFESANPKERKHFDLLNFIYHETGRTEEQIEIVEQMVERFAEDGTLWKSWASLLSKAGREREAFNVNKLHYETGRVTDEPSIIKLAEYYGYYDMPFEAAQLLERELEMGNVAASSENLIRIADLYTQAREYKRAIAPLENAAKIDSSDKLYARLGEALYQDQQCDRADRALRRAIDLGYDYGKAWSLIGACYYEKAQASPRLTCNMSDSQIANAPRTTYREKAKGAYQNVRPEDKLARDASLWIDFIDAEVQADSNRCNFIDNQAGELCMLKWEQTYRARIFNDGELIMKDQKCWKYREEYIAKYRPSEMSKN